MKGSISIKDLKIHEFNSQCTTCLHKEVCKHVSAPPEKCEEMIDESLVAQAVTVSGMAAQFAVNVLHGLNLTPDMPDENGDNER